MRISADLTVLFVAALAMAGVTAAAAAAAGDAAPNTLTAEEKKEGWTLLFDGSTTQGWRGFMKPDMEGLRWTVKDGCLGLPPAEGADTKGARDIITTKEVSGNWELKWEWKVEPGANSGVKYFITEKRGAAIGHEYQIIDDERHSDAKVGPDRRTAAYYDVLPASGAKPKTAGEWNQSRIVVRGQTVQHWLNGDKVLEYELGSEKVKSAVADSKFKEVQGFGTKMPGHILLQDHGDSVCYRSIKFRQLNAGT